MENENPLLILSTGDPAGIGPEIAVKALAALKGSLQGTVIPVFDRDTLRDALSLTGLPLVPLEIEKPEDAFSSPPGSLPYMAVPPWTEGPVPRSVPSRASGEMTLAILRKAFDLCGATEGSVLVTGPVNKVSLAMAGWEGVGHTEVLKAWAGAGDVETVFCLGELCVFFLTRHMSLRQALGEVREEKVFQGIMSIHRHMTSLGFKEPRIAVPGLNPHGGEGGLFGREEIEELEPAIARARASGITVLGPVGADSLYHQGLEGACDAILSLYHDQGHIALKTRDFYGTVTMTLGLPFLRTSVDHGTGYDIAWQGKASERSLLEAFRLALRHGAVRNSR
ncbi:MAG: 4-hydroxythreonine-4-phosphate dehydrogenase PdxA [Candidatus Eremiobacteraeota bacterium]|nr:4-hydroxythreonine-4-phosphate dehydrogenase PdxA [Candidatus Eremiobacteraeota bacterium]